MSNQLLTILPIILIFVVFYFFFIRPQNKQQKAVQQMREEMKVGDEIMTIGGFYGIIYAIDDQNVVLEMLPDFTKAMVTKNAISRVITESTAVPTDDDADDDAVETLEEVTEVTEEPEENNSEEK